jgi:hypothetical protein
MEVNFKKYRLLKDLPDLSQGATFTYSERMGGWTNDDYSDESYVFYKLTMEQEDWFEEISE